MILVLFGMEYRDDIDLDEYKATSRRMNELVNQMPGFISIEGYVGADGSEIFLARFESEKALETWRDHPEHLEAQQKGRDRYYKSFWVQVYKTIRDYGFQHDGSE
ncbi:MAG TPA: antibiotic biosynthesis monooxygenase [Chthonomonadaceae bacterium]|nr:antibiotic biosynthesis monooxygenase [Chthonomonadaceae bacterium]